MLWTDIHEIAYHLELLYPKDDILGLSFVDLKQKVLSIQGFVGTLNGCNERILEAIQQAWLEERE